MQHKQLFLSLILAIYANTAISNETQHHDEDGVIALSPEQQQNAGVIVQTVMPSAVSQALSVPAEVKANGYTSYLVSPRIDAVIVGRHVSLGAHVNEGDPLVTLFSPLLAEAQADYQLARTNYLRIKQLANKSVSASDVEAALIAFNRTRAKLKAFGVSDNAILQLENNQFDELGMLTLTAKANGVVLTDDFQQGQGVAVGEAIMSISDEQTLWVEASLTPSQKLNLNTVTQISVSDPEKSKSVSYPAKLIQTGHTIDEQTRTRTLRLAVANTDHQLHPGMFVSATFYKRSDQMGTLLPHTALVNEAGNWLIFSEVEAGEFKPVLVNVLAELGDSVYVSGLEPNSKVVTQGAFFIASEAQKANFDAHNH